jgi:hypothetical protein
VITDDARRGGGRDQDTERPAILRASATRILRLPGVCFGSDARSPPQQKLDGLLTS